MKYVIMLLISLALSSPTWAVNSETVNIPDSLLTPAQRSFVEAQSKVAAAQTNVEVAKTYIGIGHEVGVAVNDAMSAITEQANKFANTEVGHMVKWIIIYKVCKGLVLGMFAIFLTWFFIILGNTVLYLFYVRPQPDAIALCNSSGPDSTRRDVWFWTVIFTFALGVASTWIVLGNIT